MEKYLQLTWLDGLTFLKGIGVTLYVTLISIIIGTVLGVILGLIRTSRNKVISAAPLIIMEPLRNSPLVTQLFLIYFGLPMISRIVLDPIPSAIVALSLNTAAFFAVLVHSSIKSIPKIQWEIGYALGHTHTSIFKNIIFKQSLRVLIPQAITLYINQLQCSSLVALIGLADLTRTGVIITTRTLMPFAVWGIVFALYFAVSYPIGRFAKRLEDRIAFTI